MDKEKEAVTQMEQLVVFRLANEYYGIDISKVNEIIRTQEITPVPRTQKYVQGIINLRGTVIPVVDLRRVFFLPKGGQSEENRIVVVDINDSLTGMLVDSVTEVLRIPADSVEPPSSVVSSDNSKYITGIAKLDDRLIILIDLESVFTRKQSEEIAKTDLTGIAQEPAQKEMANA